MGSEARTHYEVLGLPRDASAEQIAQCYKRLLADARSKIGTEQQLDPDRLGELRSAFAVLSDPDKRASYDRGIAGAGRRPDDAPASKGGRQDFLARAWRGELRAWIPFWLMFVPTWLIAASLATQVGVMLVLLALIFVPLPIVWAAGAFLLLAAITSALLVWRCAFNVGLRFFGYLGRAVAVVLTLVLGMSIYGATSRTLGLLAVTESVSRLGKSPTARMQPLLVAAQRGDLDAVKKLVDAGADVNMRETEQHNRGQTALHYAARGKYYYPKGDHLAVARFLLAHGADVNAKADTGYTPLHVAAGLGQKDMVRFLLDNGADINAMDIRGTPLQAAVLQGHEDVVALLIERKARLNGAIAVMARMGVYKPAHTAIIRRLLDAGADPNEKGKYGRTPLDAVIPRSNEGAYLLVAGGADVGPADPKHEPRAFLLADKGNVEALNLIFERGFDPATRGPKGETFLHVANTREVVDMMLAKGLHLDVRDNNGDQPLHYAARAGNENLAEYLIAKGAPVDPQDAEGKTPLMLVRSYMETKNKRSTLDLLLDKGADLRKRDARGYAALDFAAEAGDLSILKHLLQRGASATARDRNGYTALFRARTDDIARELIARGANPKATARDGRTPLHLAAKSNHFDVAMLLIQSGANVSAADASGQTPMFLAARSPSIEKALLEAGASVNATDREGKTPLHYAARVSLTTVKFLLEKGANLNAQDRAGNTPLHEAAAAGPSYYAENLIRLGADPTTRNHAGKTAEQLAQQAARVRVNKSFAERQKAR